MPKQTTRGYPTRHITRHASAGIDALYQKLARREIIITSTRERGGDLKFVFSEVIDTGFALPWKDPTTQTLYLHEQFTTLREELGKLGCKVLKPRLSPNRAHKPWDTMFVYSPFTEGRKQVEEAVVAFLRRYAEKRVKLVSVE